MFVAKSILDLVSYDCIFSELNPEMICGILSKLDESKNQKVLWNAEQMQCVDCIEKKLIRLAKSPRISLVRY